MRMGVVGKGGSGKTSVSWMLLQTMAGVSERVVGLDADYNQHLAAMLGLSNETIPALADNKDALVQHVLGTRTDMTATTFRKTTLPAAGSALLRLDAADPFLGRFMAAVGPYVSLLRIGEFSAEDRGERCYHSRTAAADILLNHLERSTLQSHLLVDFTAGVDPFASPLYRQFDALILVVEPTLKGVEVVRQWRALLAETPTPLLIVANKLTDPADLGWLSGQLGDKVDAALWADPALRRHERGEALQWQDLLPANQAGLLALWQQLKSYSVQSLAA